VLAAGSSISEAEMLETHLAGGSGGGAGYCGLGYGHSGTQGAASSVSGGSVIATLPGSKRVLDAASVVRELAPLSITFQGQPGDVVGLLMSTSTSFRFSSAEEGVQLVDVHPPALAAWLGVADASGSLSTQYTFNDLGAGVQSKQYFLQAIVLSASGARLLGSPVSLTVLDSAF
jgi:hypothetical protein